jgi:hypothetical protein
MLAPRLLAGEEIVVTGAAWYADTRRPHLVFIARHYRLVALTDRRLLVFPRHRPRRSRGRHGTHPLLEASLESLELRRAGGARLLYPVVLDADDGRTVVLEFRLEERPLGRALAGTLRGSARAR